MNIILTSGFLVLGIALAAGVPGMLYFLLPAAVLEAGARHGRYLGLGPDQRSNASSQGSRVAWNDSRLGQGA